MELRRPVPEPVPVDKSAADAAVSPRRLRRGRDGSLSPEADADAVYCSALPCLGLLDRCRLRYSREESPLVDMM